MEIKHIKQVVSNNQEVLITGTFRQTLLMAHLLLVQNIFMVMVEHIL
jgi:hypothetical protein